MMVLAQIWPFEAVISTKDEGTRATEDARRDPDDASSAMPIRGVLPNQRVLRPCMYVYRGYWGYIFFDAVPETVPGLNSLNQDLGRNILGISRRALSRIAPSDLLEMTVPVGMAEPALFLLSRRPSQRAKTAHV